MEQIEIKTASIGLDQFLKWANIAESGGDAKHLIQEGWVRVNGKIETRRSKKLYPGDVIDVDERGSWQIKGND
ncbi:MAG: RNA-binding S4 domain-containing protein [Halanaerobium sp.]|nr:RNA-binding S4 domain-containing protein [Halanaerobium sp.]